MSKKVPDWVRPSVAANLAGVDRRTIYRWAKSGLVASNRTNILRVLLADVIERAN